MASAAERGATAWQHDGMARLHAAGWTSDASVVRTGASDSFPGSTTAVTAATSVFDVAVRQPTGPPPRREHPFSRPGAAETQRPRRGGDHMRRRRGPFGRAVRLAFLATGVVLAAVSLAGFTGLSLAEADTAPRPAPAGAGADDLADPPGGPPAGLAGTEAASPAVPELAAAVAPAAVTGGRVLATVGGGYQVSLQVGQANAGRGGDLTVGISRAGTPLPATPGAAPVRLVTIRSDSLAYQEAAPRGAAGDGTLRFRPRLEPGAYRILVQFHDLAGAPRMAAFTLQLD